MLCLKTNKNIFCSKKLKTKVVFHNLNCKEKQQLKNSNHIHVEIFFKITNFIFNLTKTIKQTITTKINKIFLH